MTSSILFAKDIEVKFQLSLQDQRKGEVCLTFYHRLKEFCWYDKSLMTTNMKMWRKLAKKGNAKICKYNNRSFEYKGVIYYTFVLQSYKNEVQQPENVCPLMLSAFNTLVTGYGYCFRTQENRDSIYDYVMKDIDEPN